MGLSDVDSRIDLGDNFPNSLGLRFGSPKPVTGFACAGLGHLYIAGGLRQFL